MHGVWWWWLCAQTQTYFCRYRGIAGTWTQTLPPLQRQRCDVSAPTGSIHSARLSRSPRLRRVFSALCDGREHTTLDLIREANVCAVNSIISELRRNGLVIRCHREGDVWRYRMATPPEVACG